MGKHINRLIILGNGFDLAHGLRTSFDDFVKFLITSRIRDETHFPQELIEIIDFHNPYKGIMNTQTLNPNLNLDLKSFINEINHNLQANLNLNNGGTLYGKLKGKDIRLDSDFDFFDIKNQFLKTVIESLNDYNWVDFERTYYIELKKLIGKFNGDMNWLLEQAVQLNIEFEKIIKELEKYLIWLMSQKTSKRIEAFSRIFDQSTIEMKVDQSNDILEVQDTLILSFNYTNTITLYDLVEDHQVLNIHGQCQDIINEIICGYGDEMDEDYIRIESLDEDELLRHFKSPQYSKTEYYHILNSFINSDNYHVDLIGHSCGLSDRVLLNTIFENSLCKQIRVFHHKNRIHHTKMSIHIKRHFSNENKGISRVKLLPFDEKNLCPQAEGTLTKKDHPIGWSEYFGASTS